MADTCTRRFGCKALQSLYVVYDATGGSSSMMVCEGLLWLMPVRDGMGVKRKGSFISTMTFRVKVLSWWYVKACDGLHLIVMVRLK